MSQKEKNLIDINSFIKKCENLENFEEIRNFSPPPGEMRKEPFNFEKFKEGSKKVAQLYKKICK